jgi:acyl-CoA thioester hydrolase
MHYVLFSEQQQEIVADGEAVIVFVDKDSMKKALIPENLRKVIIDLEATVQNNLLNL